MLDHIFNKGGLYVTASVLTIMASGVAVASEGGSRHAARGFAVEEVIVNARKRDERLQEVPEAITVLSAQRIEDAGIVDLRTLAQQLPNLTMNYSFRKSIIKINSRGFSTPQFGDAPVAYVVDGFSVTDLDFINQGIFDVENIQVLRGPQGALYGRGALQGAILINTKQPTNTFSGNLKAAYQSGADVMVSGAVSGPIVEDVLQFRIGGYVQNRDGQLKNDFGNPLDFVNDYSIRGQLKLMPSDDLTVDLFARVTDGDYGTAQVIVGVPYTEYDASASYDSVNQDYVGRNDRLIQEYGLKVEWNLPYGSLTSLTNYNTLDDTVFADADFSMNNFGVQADYSDRKSFSQELRFASPDDQDFRWMTGLVYQDRSWDRVYSSGVPVDCNTCEPDWDPDVAYPTALITPKRKSTNIGAFVQASYDVTDRLEVSGALRYDADERENVDRATNLSAGFPADVKLEDTFKEWQPKIAVSYGISDDVLTYLSASRGFRSGGFNALNFSFQQGIYEKEVSETLEFGVKSTLLDGRATLNGAFFVSEADNYQRSLFDVASNTLGIQNIDKVDIKGFEVEFSAAVTENLQLSASYGYTDTEIKNFRDLQTAANVAETYAALAGLSADQIVAAGAAATAQAEALNAASNGNHAPYIPKHTLNLSVRHELDLTDSIRMISFVSLRQVGTINWEPDILVAKSSAKEIVNARITFETDDWQLALYANNLFDTRHPVDQFLWNPGVTGAVNPNKPRSYGMSVKHSF